MRILCCDPIHKYLFIGVNRQEIEEQIIPLQEDLLSESSGPWASLYVSSVATREAELAAQKEIKANPYVGKTLPFSRYIGEPCTHDAYIVVNPSLDELYFVPFDHFAPERWDGDSPWHAIDKQDIALLAEVQDVPFALNGVAYDKESTWTELDAEMTLAEFSAKMGEWKKRGKEFIFAMVMAQLRKYRIYPKEAMKLLIEGGCDVPEGFWKQDYAHLVLQGHLYDQKKEEVVKHRTIEEEEAYLDALSAERDALHVGDQLIADYLDGIVSWDDMVALFDDPPELTPGKKMDDAMRKKWLWLNK